VQVNPKFNRVEDFPYRLIRIFRGDAVMAVVLKVVLKVMATLPAYKARQYLPLSILLPSRHHSGKFAEVCMQNPPFCYILDSYNAKQVVIGRQDFWKNAYSFLISIIVGGFASYHVPRTKIIEGTHSRLPGFGACMCFNHDCFGYYDTIFSYLRQPDTGVRNDCQELRNPSADWSERVCRV